MTFMGGSVHGGGGGGAWTGLCSAHGLYDREGPARDPHFGPNGMAGGQAGGLGPHCVSVSCLSAMGTWGKMVQAYELIMRAVLVCVVVVVVACGGWCWSVVVRACGLLCGVGCGW